MRAEANDTVDKLLTFICSLRPQQADWIFELKKEDFTGSEPEKTAWHHYSQAHFVGIRSSVAHLIIKHLLTSKGIPFDAKKLNDQRYGAKMNWERVRTQQWPPPPPLVLDPMLSRSTGRTSPTSGN